MLNIECIDLCVAASRSTYSIATDAKTQSQSAVDRSTVNM